MGDKITSNFSVSSNGSGVSEADVFAVTLTDDLCELSSLVGGTPLDELIKAETDQEEAIYLDIRKEVVAGVLSWLFAPIRGYVPSPNETATRLWVLCFLINPSLIGGMSLSQIGKLFTDEISRATLSARVKKASATLNIKSRNSKSATSCAKYSEIQKDRHAKKQEEERKEKRRLYLEEYRRANREKLLAQHKDYYRKNKKRILDTQKKRRKGR
jgi:hypothetical protein